MLGLESYAEFPLGADLLSGYAGGLGLPDLDFSLAGSMDFPDTDVGLLNFAKFYLSVAEEPNDTIPFSEPIVQVK